MLKADAAAEASESAKIAPAAKKRLFRDASEMTDRALNWISWCATAGSLYFLGVCAGYLIFASVLPEFRLAFAFGGLFVGLGILRLIAFRAGAHPSRYSAMVY